MIICGAKSLTPPVGWGGLDRGGGRRGGKRGFKFSLSPITEIAEERGRIGGGEGMWGQNLSYDMLTPHPPYPSYPSPLPPQVPPPHCHSSTELTVNIIEVSHE